MNFCYVLLCSLLLYLPCAAQEHIWEAYAVDSLAAFRFPVAPEELNVPGTLAANNSANKDSLRIQASQAFRAEDASAVYLLVSVPLLDPHPRQGTVAEREAYYKTQSIPSMARQMRGELLEQTVVTAAPGFDSFTVKIRAPTANGSPGIKYVRILTTDKRIYQLYYIPKDKTGKAGAAQRAQFFDTFILAAQPR